MTWREKTVVALLLLVARIVNEDTTIEQDLRRLATHIAVGRV